MKPSLLYFFTFFCFSIAPKVCSSQAKQDKYQTEDFEGGMLNPSPYPDIPAPKVPLLKILKYDNRNLMTGNACVHEETEKMGFEYLVVCNKDLAETNKLYVFFYNLGTNLELTFRNGPGWKLRLKQRIVECRRNSSDFVW